MRWPLSMNMMMPSMVFMMDGESTVTKKTLKNYV